MHVAAKHEATDAGQSVLSVHFLVGQVPASETLSKNAPLPAAGVDVSPLICTLNCSWNFWPASAVPSIFSCCHVLSVGDVASCTTELPKTA